LSPPDALRPDVTPRELVRLDMPLVDLYVMPREPVRLEASIVLAYPLFPRAITNF
jgi:hypothetical protein